MATSRKTSKNTPSVTEFPQPASATAVEDVPQEFQDQHQEELPEPTPDPEPSRNPLRRKPPGITPPTGNFFARVASVPRADWGTRVYLYLYVLEPMCNLRQSGGKSYLNRYSEPVKDEHQIMLEYGSGRYRLMLAWNRVSAEDSNELARYEFEIYNPSHPPKVPKEAWINDARNAKWEALLPKDKPAAPAGGSMLDAMKVYGEIRRDLREEIGDPEEKPRANEVLETMRAAKELFAAPATATGQAPAPAADPFDTAKKIMEMRGNDPMIALLMARMEAQDKAAEAMRQREWELQRELRQMQNQPSKGIADQLLELLPLIEKFEPLKKLFGNGASAVVEAAGRPAKTTFFDFVSDFAATPAGAQIGHGLASLMANLSARPSPQPQPGQIQNPPIILNQQNPDGTAQQEHPDARLERIGRTISQPMIFQYLYPGESGEVFAQWMYDGMPEDYLFLKALGPDVITSKYRSVPQAWAMIQHKESEFVEFVKEFCAWDPNEDETPAAGPAAGGGVVSLEDDEEITD